MTAVKTIGCFRPGLAAAALLMAAGLAGCEVQATAPQGQASSAGALAAASVDRRAETAAEPTLSEAEASAWAEARAADAKVGYEVYLAAYPTGAFAADARAALDRLEQTSVKPAPATAARPARTVERVVVAQAAPAAPRVNVAAACRAYVDQKLSQPSRTGRAVGGAAAGCAVGALAGGDDGRNCAVGALAGAAAGAITAENRERRRMQEVQYCIANGGPPR